jgi:hypothetical protein
MGLVAKQRQRFAAQNYRSALGQEHRTSCSMTVGTTVDGAHIGTAYAAFPEDRLGTNAPESVASADERGGPR